jgi:folate-binding protein YgfZ
MTQFWHPFTLENTQSHITDINNTSYLMPLFYLGVLRVSGEDAASFLQNLFTNDIHALNIHQAQLSGFCTPKGRLLASFLVVRRSEDFLLILPKELCANLQQRLSMYVFRSKVSVVDASNELSLVGLTQHENQTYKISDLPDATYSAVEINTHLLIKIPDSLTSRYLCIGSQQELGHLCSNLLSSSWEITNEASWQLFNITQGLPDVYQTTQEKFTPQQLNFDLIGGVSFKKGCYPGQEIVARLHYLGTPSRRLFSAQCKSETLPTAGDEITSQDNAIVGHVVSAQFQSEDTLHLLISLKLSEIDSAMFIHEDTLTNIMPLATD